LEELLYFCPILQHDAGQTQGIRTNQHGSSYLEEELVTGVSAIGCSHIWVLHSLGMFSMWCHTNHRSSE